MLILRRLLSFFPSYLLSLPRVLYHLFRVGIVRVLSVLSMAWLSQASPLVVVMCSRPPVPLGYSLSLCSQVFLLVQTWRVRGVIRMVVVAEDTGILQSANSVGGTLLLVP